MLHWRGFANKTLGVRGSFRGVKIFFTIFKAAGFPKENMRLEVNYGTWILLLQFVKHDDAL